MRNETNFWDETRLLTAVADQKLQIILWVVESLKIIVSKWNFIDNYLMLFISWAAVQQFLDI